MRSLAGDRAHAGQAIDAGKQQEQSGDEGKRKQVNAKLQQVFNTTQTEVQGILTGLDRKVDEAFTQGEKAARDAFTADHKQRMERYKDERYSGWLGKARWVKDKFAGLPAEANQIFEQAKGGYTRRMQQVIESVADIIGNELTRAKARIAQGREQIAAEVSRMPAELQAVAKDAVEDFTAKFDGLSQSVDAKSDELVDTLATRYTDAVKAVDEEIAAEKEKNKGLIAKAVDAVKGVIDTILKLKDLLMGVLAKAASAVAAIIKDPIKFLGNLVSALGAGLKAFIANIGKHLSAGLMGFLLGAMAASGVLLPSKFDIQGLIMLVAGVMGLTWAALRGRIVKRGVPEQAMTQVERVMPMAQKMHTGGVGGVWQDVKGKVGDLKGMLFSKISEYLIPTVLIAGITWILSLLNPASAFIKACKMIVDIISFIVARGAQIAEFVNAVLDAVIAVAGGALGSVPGLIESALGRSVPVLIGALAAILGIGGIAQKIQSFVKALAKPVGKAIDWIVGKIVAFGKKLWNKIKSKFGKKDKGPDTRNDRQKQRDLDAGLNAAERLVKDGKSEQQVRAALPGIQSRYKMTSLTLSVAPGADDKQTYTFSGEVNPRGQRVIPGGGPNRFKARKTGAASFEGEFANFPASAWGSYDSFGATPHPANTQYSHPNGHCPRPTGSYSVSGSATGGNVNTADWRARMDRERAAERAKLQPTLGGQADRKAMTTVAARYGMSDWRDLYLLSWEEHHIKPVNWGGGNGNANLIYLRCTEHDRFTGYWNSMKATIMKDIP
jgi:hypothetical protein